MPGHPSPKDSGPGQLFSFTSVLFAYYAVNIIFYVNYPVVSYLNDKLALPCLQKMLQVSQHQLFIFLQVYFVFWHFTNLFPFHKI
ncbi:hypothetical protein ES708_29925 [subsurface metagenome]